MLARTRSVPSPPGKIDDDLQNKSMCVYKAQHQILFIELPLFISIRKMVYMSTNFM